MEMNFTEENKSYHYLPDLKELLNSFKNIEDKSDYNAIDEASYNFLKSQINLNEEIFKEDTSGLENFLDENVDMSNVIHPLVLKDIIRDKINELMENGEDIDNKLIKTSVTLEKNGDRNINIEFMDKNEIDSSYVVGMIDSSEIKLPKLNDLIKEQIEIICRDMFQDTGIFEDDDELKQYIEERIEDYKEEPYTVDYLEGYNNGFINEKLNE